MNDMLKLPKALATRLKKVSLMQGDAPDAIARSAIAEHLRYLEWKEKAVARGDADIVAGRILTTAEVLSAIEKQRARRVGKY